jgi:2,3-bisphosphoglycerate-independent phosphoglycerate mutase
MNLYKDLLLKSETNAILLVADGLGGVPHPEHGFKTELEAARTPHLDELAKRSVLGLATPVAPGVTPGSGPAHLSLFGYDPVEIQIGRGVLEALGVGVELQAGDVAIRGNFATKDKDGIIVDRRAGRIPTEESSALIERMSSKIETIDDVQVFLTPGVEHRFAVVLRGPGLCERVSETDPQKEGNSPNPPKALVGEAEKTRQVIERFVTLVEEVLAGEPRANTVLLRGYAEKPEIEPFPEKWGMRALGIATYPMYKGLARLVGMETPDVPGGLMEEIEHLERHFGEFDFFFVHYKPTDKAGEDADFEKKVRAIEEVDAIIPRILALEPDVLVVTGDHSTPSLIGAHSWHPNPLLLHSRFAGAEDAAKFQEATCKLGYLGHIASKDILPLILANAKRLKKFGA